MEEVENLKVEKHKEKIDLLKTQETVQDELNRLKMEKIEIRTKQHSIDEEMHKFKTLMDKSKQRGRILVEEIKVLEAEFWRKRNGM